MLLSFLSMLVLPSVTLAAVQGNCQSRTGATLQFQIEPGIKGSLAWQEEGATTARQGEAELDELYRAFVVYFDDGRFVVEEGVTRGRAYAKLSLADHSINLICEP